MQRYPAEAVIEHMIKEASEGNGSRIYRNPKDTFDEMEENGNFISLPKKTVNQKRINCRELGDMLWAGRSYASVFEILVRAMSSSAVSSRARKIIAGFMTDSIGVKNPGIYSSNGDSVEPVPMVWINEMDTPADEYDDPNDDDEAPAAEDSLKSYTRVPAPKDIYSFLDKHVYAQEEAKKAASMLLWGHMKGNKSNILFMGPTGCGKTEIFRQLKKLYEDIYIVDASAITEDGWKGNYKIADIFRNIGTVAKVERSIIVMDEADKFFEPATNSSGENVSFSKQNELLKIIEGEEYHLNDTAIDTSNISWVFLGSFESLLEAKKERPNGLGFGGDIKKSQVSYTDNFTSEDLVKYAGVRNEIAGRIERIVQLSPMDADSLYQILIDPEMSPITELTKRYGKKLELSEFMKRRIAKEAADSHMGVRYMRSRIKRLMEDKIFEDDESEGYRISC